MEPADLTVQVLREIRDEVRQTNQRLDQTNQRLDQTNQRLDERFDQLGQRLVESEIRTATAVTALVGTLNDIRSLLADRLEVRERLERCEREIASLKERIAT